MKNIKSLLLLLSLLISTSVWAQSPNKMSYQAVIRDTDSKLVTSQVISMQISILQGEAPGTVVYVETQTPTTNINGLVSIEIGTGASSDKFGDIDWSSGPYFIKTETDPAGNNDYTITGISQLLSVPYALHANTADSIVGGISITETDPIFGTSIANGITAADTTNWNNHTVDTDTKLDSTGIANLGYVAGGITSEVDGSITNEIQQLATNGDTIFISAGNYIVLPGLSNIGSLVELAVQQRLDDGETPFDIYNSDITLLDSLYGKTYQGGLLFYLNTSNGTGLLAAPSDQGDIQWAPWACSFDEITGADGITIGTGAQNTIYIIDDQCTTLDMAADLCANLTLGSYSDWFLPSKDELYQMYLKIGLGNTLPSGNVGGFSYGKYWSSTEDSAYSAWALDFYEGNQISYGKGNPIYVRAVRTF